MELSLMFHPILDKLFPVFHHVQSLVPIKIHPILEFSIRPAQLLKLMKCSSSGNCCLSKPFPCENGLHFWTGNNLDNILSLQETPLCHQVHLDLLCNIFVINDHWLFPVQLVEREVPPPQELHNPLMDASCIVCSTSLCLGHNLWCFSPGISQVLVCIKVQKPNHWYDMTLDNHIKIFSLYIFDKLCVCLLKLGLIT